MNKLENQYLDYASFKKTNEKLLEYLLSNNSLIIARFKYVLLVVDYLFEKVVKENKKLTLDEEEMFEVGYQYLFDRFNTINLLKEHTFNNKLEKMEQLAKSINLLFYIEDFIDEIDSLDGEHKEEHTKFADLEDSVMQFIEEGRQVPDELFALVDDISLNIFTGLGHDYYSITDIYYDIAVELELIDEDDFDYYDVFENIN